MNEKINLGLLKDPIVYAFDEELNKQIFSIKGNDAIVVEVTFVGDYEGILLKEDKNILDDIYFDIVND